MNLKLSVSTKDQLEIRGGITESVFPEVEAWLSVSSEHQNALQYIAIRKKVIRYTSMMDFLFCEIFTGYRAACFRYYLNKASMLKDMVTDEEIVYFNRVLLKAMEIAYKAFSDQRQLSWANFRNQVLELAA